MATKKKSDEQAAEPADLGAVDAPEPVVNTDPAPSYTGRPNDTPIEKPSHHFTASTFAERAKARNKRVKAEDADSK